MRKYKIEIPKHKKLSPVRTHYKVKLNAALKMKKKKKIAVLYKNADIFLENYTIFSGNFNRKSVRSRWCLRSVRQM